MKGSVNERFWAKVAKTESCWLWTGGVARKGYGNFWEGNRLTPAPRFAFVQAFGVMALAPGMYVCHHCDNPRCVRPDHLFSGFPKDNSADMVAKGKARGAPRGEANLFAKLTVEIVRDIRAKVAAGTHSQSELARLHGVGNDVVNRVVRRKAWAWVA